MLGRRLALAALFILPTVACGATLTRGPTGWHDEGQPYSIEPLEDDSLFSAGWTLAGYELKKEGYRRNDSLSEIDLKLRRVEDDGVLIVAHFPIEEEDRAKGPDVFAERWLDRVVQNPKDDDDDYYERFADVAPPLKTVANGHVGLQFGSATVVHGHSVEVDRQQAFSARAGEAVEMTATLSPAGSAPDRRLYVAVIKQTSSENLVIVAYGNSPGRFDKGLPEATSFAHRIHF